MTPNEQKLHNAFKMLEEEELQAAVDASEVTPPATHDREYRKRKKDILEIVFSAGSTEKEPIPISAAKKSAGVSKNTRKAFRVALLVAALILLFSFTAFGIQQVYEFYHVNVNETDSDVFLTPDPNTKSDLFGKYTYIPDGYKRVKCDRSLWYQMEEIIYEDGSGNQIVCFSAKITPGGVNSFDTEHGDLIDIKINGSSGKAIHFDYGDNVTASSVIWITGNYYHVVDGDGLSIAEVKKVAENRK